jgi:hypothetical protein
LEIVGKISAIGNVFNANARKNWNCVGGRVGKTAILDRFVNGWFSEAYMCTLASDVYTQDITVDNHVFGLEVV